MDSDDALRYALGKPGAWVDSPWGENHEVAKVGPKIFLFPGVRDGRPVITVKNTAEAVEELKQRFGPDAGPAPYLDKRLWAQLRIDRIPDEDVRELIDDSYRLVVAGLPRSQRPGLSRP
jgi:predicted DNA-binding protein (MmcQ/YjbR family)